MTVLLIACGTSTLKSPLLRAFFTPHVHSRLRKRLSRCTLDCGFKTPESPALRGFVAERGPITGTSLYLVLKSNGLHLSKNLPVKFGFLPIGTPANIVKKLSSQRCSKSLFIAFSAFLTNGPRLLSRVKSGTRSPSPTGSHTVAHTAKHGVFPPSATVWSCAASEIALNAAFVTLIPPCFYIHTFPGSL